MERGFQMKNEYDNNKYVSWYLLAMIIFFSVVAIYQSVMYIPPYDVIHTVP